MVKLLWNEKVYGWWNVTGLLGKGGGWFFGFSRKPPLPPGCMTVQEYIAKVRQNPERAAAIDRAKLREAGAKAMRSMREKYPGPVVSAADVEAELRRRVDAGEARPFSYGETDWDADVALKYAKDWARHSSGGTKC